MQFLRVARAYLVDGPAGAWRLRRRVLTGIVLAIVPLSFVVPIGIRVATGAYPQPVYGAYIAGAPLLLPLLHLLLELARGRTQAA